MKIYLFLILLTLLYLTDSIGIAFDREKEGVDQMIQEAKIESEKFQRLYNKEFYKKHGD